MLDEPNRDRAAERREATRQEILSAAWAVAREQGLSQLTLREVAARVGMRAPSLYSHFASKNAIYDAMFADAWTQYLAADAAIDDTVPNARDYLRESAHVFFDFAVADLARHQLMNQRTIPGFEPSAEAYAPAVQVVEQFRAQLARYGVTRDEDVDLCTALIGGLIDQQLANDPGGDRWGRLVDRAVDMLADNLGLPPENTGPETRHRTREHRRGTIMTTDQTTRNRPRTSQLDHQTAMRLALVEYERVTSLFEQLTPEQWSAPTDCPHWDVRAMAGHMLGMAQMVASVPEMLRQQIGSGKRQKRDGGLTVDALTALQVEKNAALTTAELVEAMRRTGPKAARGRRRMPAVVRNRAIPEEQDVDGQKESWTFGFLFDVILTRDPFMHRIDITHATGREMELTADHEGRIIDDVVREWAARHGEPYALELTGTAGGGWSQGEGDHISMDPLEFCRTLSGRVRGEGLLSVQVPF